MSIEIRSKSGKKLGVLSDNINEDDFIIVEGQKIRLEDAYEDAKLLKTFNDEVKDATK
jgi:hypothetical protein